MENQSDEVNNPVHYNSEGMEVIDLIRMKSTKEEFVGYLKGNVMKYLFRYKYKGKPRQDLEKCRWYLNKLLEETEDGNTPTI